MKSSKRIAPYKPPKELAQALGYSCISDAEPYLNYILQARTEKYDAKGYLSFIIHIIQHFTQKGLPPNSVPQSDTIRALLQKLEKDGFLQIFTDTASDPTKRKIEVEDHVMGILGRWTMLLDHFQSRGGVRSLVEESHNLAKLVGKSGLLASDGSHVLSTPANMQSEVVKTAISLVQLLSKLDSSTNNAAASGGPLQGSSIFSNSFVTHAPIMDMDLESLSISSESLNAFILHIDAAVDISWTLDLSRHMILTTANGRHKLEVFAMPCMFKATHCTAEITGLPSGIATEIKYSYAMLFNAWPNVPKHARWLRFLGLQRICWCWRCSALRYRSGMLKAYERWCNDKQRTSSTTQGVSLSLMDASIKELVEKTPLHEWNQSMFPQLWSRIARAHQHQNTTKPWNFWMLFHDRRDTLQYWTFLFAALVLTLTLFQVVLGIAQVVGSFN